MQIQVAPQHIYIRLNQPLSRSSFLRLVEYLRVLEISEPFKLRSEDPENPVEKLEIDWWLTNQQQILNGKYNPES